MITDLEIDGFRSLNNFKLKINPGLNILVGPNGAGKTNIILFFEFLTALFEAPVEEAVNRCGGAGAIFRKTDEGGLARQISMTISGKTTYSSFEKEARWIDYKCTLIIGLSEEDDFVFYRSQLLEVSVANSPKRRKPQSWDFVFSSKREEDGGHSNAVKIEKIDFRKARNLFRDTPISGSSGTRKQRIKTIETYLTRFLGDGVPILVSSQRIVAELRSVIEDFLGGEALNIIPSIAKKLEDSATPPGIRRDGGGLAATLYFLERLKNRPRRGIAFRRPPTPTYYAMGYRSREKLGATPRTLDRIIEYIKLVNEEILNVGVEKDHDDNLLKIFVDLKGESKNLRLPFSLMSDGTVKWIALVASIFTNQKMFAIEEPENFIHPAMQQEILKLMRSVTEQKNKDYFVLMTTHSETLLNAASPKEVITVRMEKGRTIVKRPSNVQALQDEINRSGFGLGFLYLTGTLDDG